MAISTKTVATSHGDIVVNESPGTGMPVVLIHGNSSCKEVFDGILAGPLADTNRLIAVDLPGHGKSGDARDPQRTYTMPGYAQAVTEALDALGVDRAVVVGWSLGGHVAMEMIPVFDGMVGAMILGAPPVGQGAEKVMAGFRPSPNAGLVGQLQLSAADFEMFMLANYGPVTNETLRKALLRTDGRSRAVMLQSFIGGTASDQRAIVENSPVPISVVNGADDPLVNVEYIGNVAYSDLWDNHCYVLRGAGHASFLHAPEAFGAILERFVADMAQRAGKQRGSRASKARVA